MRHDPDIQHLPAIAVTPEIFKKPSLVTMFGGDIRAAGSFCWVKLHKHPWQHRTSVFSVVSHGEGGGSMKTSQERVFFVEGSRSVFQGFWGEKSDFCQASGLTILRTKSLCVGDDLPPTCWRFWSTYYNELKAMDAVARPCVKPAAGAGLVGIYPDTVWYTWHSSDIQLLYRKIIVRCWVGEIGDSWRRSFHRHGRNRNVHVGVNSGES